MANNRFTDRNNTEENAELDFDQMLLNIMQSEYPEDPVYSQGLLTQEQMNMAAAEDAYGPLGVDPAELGSPAPRNDRGVVNVSIGVAQHIQYELDKTYPSVDEDTIDELLDDEFEFFVDDATQPVPATSGEFLINTEIELNPPDFHDAYITRGPSELQNRANEIGDQEEAVRSTFCVYYIDNDIAYPIPNYKTLEVMLVERGKTYSAIREATQEDRVRYDMTLEGNFVGDQTPSNEPNPIEEFQFRQMIDRTVDWSPRVRYDSGYRPNAPFLRDPGDYVVPVQDNGSAGPSSVRYTPGNEFSLNGQDYIGYYHIDGDQYYPGDPLTEAQIEQGVELAPLRVVKPLYSVRYSPPVFLRQTFRERLREKFEGKMIIAAWPKPYNAQAVNSIPAVTTEGLPFEIADDANETDDLSTLVRMMVNGYWKQVTSERVFRLYASINNFDLSTYQPNPNLSTNTGFDPDVNLEGEFGYINVLVNNGGITSLAAAPLLGDDNRDNDYPTWNAFPHIVDVDELDPAEYRLYLDAYSNGGAPFDNEILTPYEPRGSVAYYSRGRLLELQGQAQAQENFDQIKDQLYELWPVLANRAAELQILFDAQPPNFSNYIDTQLMAGDMYRLVYTAGGGKWEYVKKKAGDLKVKDSSDNLLNVIDRSSRIKSNLDQYDLTDPGRYKWCAPIFNDDIEPARPWTSNKIRYGNDINQYIADLLTYTQLTSDYQGPDGDYFSLKDRATQIDGSLINVKQQLQDISIVLSEMNYLLITATDVEDLQTAYDTFLQFQNFMNEVGEQALLDANDLRLSIDRKLVFHVNEMYKMIQYVRRSVHDNIGNKRKFGIRCPENVKTIIKKYIPGANLDNYLPE